MRADWVAEEGRYLIYPGGDDWLMDNPMWDTAAKLLSDAFPHEQIVMATAYDYGKSTQFAAVDMFRKDGKKRKKERYIFVMTLEWVR